MPKEIVTESNQVELKGRPQTLSSKAKRGPSGMETCGTQMQPVYERCQTVFERIEEIYETVQRSLSANGANAEKPDGSEWFAG